MRWCRLYKEFATDPKIQSMSEEMQRRLIMLFCWHIDYEIYDFISDVDFTEKTMMNALRINENELQKTKLLFIKKGYINGDWTLINWEKRQPIYRKDKVIE